MNDSQDLPLDDFGHARETLRRILERLDGLEIPYAVVGNIALFLHGFRQYTDDVELLVRPSGMDMHYRLDPAEYWSIYPKHADLKDQRTGTQIQFFLAGDGPRGMATDLYAYPDPVESSVLIDGIPCLALPALVDMKLALGTAPNGRMRHLSDVQEATRRIGLPREFCEQLNPRFQNKFLELWLPRTPDDVDEH